MLESQPEPGPGRPEPRRFVALLVITAATAMALGRAAAGSRRCMAANDISRWCTVWSLLERGTYVIDDCPWQIETQDKVYAAAGQARRARTEPVKHFYSSKPPLLPTLIAGLLYPARRLTRRAARPRRPPGAGGALGPEARPGRAGQDSGRAREAQGAGEVAGLCLLLQAGPDRCSTSSRSPSSWSSSPGCSTATRPNDWAWFFSLFAAAFGTYLLPSRRP